MISIGPTLYIRWERRKVTICCEVLSKLLAVLDTRIERNFRAVVGLRVDLGSIDCVTFEREVGPRKNNTDPLVELPQDGTVHWYHLGPNCLRVGRHAQCWYGSQPQLCYADALYPGRDCITITTTLPADSIMLVDCSWTSRNTATNLEYYHKPVSSEVWTMSLSHSLK